MGVRVSVVFVCGEVGFATGSYVGGTTVTTDTHWNISSGSCTPNAHCISRDPNSRQPCLITIQSGWSGTVAAQNITDESVSDKFFVDGVVLSGAELVGIVPRRYILWDTDDPIFSAQLCRMEESQDSSWMGSMRPWSNEADLVEAKDVCAPCSCEAGQQNTAEENCECVPCAAGRFKASRGYHSCSACVIGTFASDIGATACEECTGDWHVEERGTSCIGCETHPDLRFEHDFVKVKLLGEGSFGEVWHCQSRVDGQEYAVKVVQKVVTESFKVEDAWDEAQVAASVATDHAHIVRYHTAWLQYRCAHIPAGGNFTEKTANLYIQMQLCSGGTLYEWLREREIVMKKGVRSEERWDWAQEMVSYMHQSLLAVVHMHTHGLIHRDIKPRNIFFTSGGSVRLGDFGLATYAWDNAGASSKDENEPAAGEGFHTRKAGTPLYMAPEQRIGRVYSFSADIHALGKTFAELLCLFRDVEQRKYFLDHLHHGALPYHVIHDFPETTAVILSMTDPSAQARPSASEVLDKMPAIVAEIERMFELMPPAIETKRVVDPIDASPLRGDDNVSFQSASMRT